MTASSGTCDDIGFSSNKNDCGAAGRAGRVARRSWRGLLTDGDGFSPAVRRHRTRASTRVLEGVRRTTGERDHDVTPTLAHDGPDANAGGYLESRSIPMTQGSGGLRRRSDSGVRLCGHPDVRRAARGPPRETDYGVF